MCVASHVQAFYMYNVPVMFIVLYLSHILISLWLTSVQEPIMIGSCFSVNFFFHSRCKSLRQNSKWNWKMMLKCLHVVFHYQTGNQQKSLKKGLTVYGCIKNKNIHNYWRYLSMAHQCSKASFHSCAIFGSILYNTVIWILWSKQSQFPLVI